MRAVVDTGPLLAAANAREKAHRLAVALIGRLGRGLVIPLPVLVETDHLIRQRAGAERARRLLRFVAAGGYGVAYLSPGLLRRAVELDEGYADLDLGLTDASVMAVAERERLPIFTFDFTDFRATESVRGPWPLLVSESILEKAIERGS